LASPDSRKKKRTTKRSIMGRKRKSSAYGAAWYNYTVSYKVGSK
jgi:hypothetical protein